MENKSDQNRDCSCEGNCCPPKRKPKWMTILSAGILIIAIAIVMVKLIQDRSVAAVSGDQKIRVNASCSDTSEKSVCDTVTNPSCCPQKRN